MKLTASIVVVFLAACVPSRATAEFIQPIIAGFSTQEGGYGGRVAENTVNGSGLSSESPLATHNSNSTDCWHTSVNDPNRDNFWDPSNVDAFISFDLGGPTILSTAFIWQYSESYDWPNYLGRGVDVVDILVAPPSGVFTYLGTFQLYKGLGDGAEPVQTIDLGGINNPATHYAQYVRFDIRSNFNTGISDVVGLAEVRFGGLPVPELMGDYNGDGFVDAADYVVWRKNDGTPSRFETWRTNFGQSTSAVGAGSETSTLNSAPEPASAGLGLLALIIASARDMRFRRA